MKKIIDGKVYDTDKATEVGCRDNNRSRNDFDYIEETLYRKRTGEYFLHGVGGARTKYSVSYGQNMWSSGEKIIPISYKNAMSWAEENLNTDDYEKEFGEIKDDEGSEVITVSLPSSSAAKLRRCAYEKGMGLSAYIASLV